MNKVESRSSRRDFLISAAGAAASVAVATSGSALAAGGSGNLRVGEGVADITPPLGIEMGGFTGPPGRSDGSGRSAKRPRFGHWWFSSVQLRLPSARWMSPRSARRWQPGCRPPSASRPAFPPPMFACAQPTPTACRASASFASGASPAGVHGPGRKAGSRGGLQGQR